MSNGLDNYEIRCPVCKEYINVFECIKKAVLDYGGSSVSTCPSDFCYHEPAKVMFDCMDDCGWKFYAYLWQNNGVTHLKIEDDDCVVIVEDKEFK